MTEALVTSVAIFCVLSWLFPYTPQFRSRRAASEKRVLLDIQQFGLLRAVSQFIKPLRQLGECRVIGPGQQIPANLAQVLQLHQASFNGCHLLGSQRHTAENLGTAARLHLDDVRARRKLARSAKE